MKEGIWKLAMWVVGEIPCYKTVVQLCDKFECLG